MSVGVSSMGLPQYTDTAVVIAFCPGCAALLRIHVCTGNA